MKKPKKSVESSTTAPPVRTTVVAPTEQIGIVSVTHFQSVKQSIDYQSADCGYTIKINCLDNRKAIRKTIRRCESIVEDFLVEKIDQQRELLQGLGKQNR